MIQKFSKIYIQWTLLVVFILVDIFVWTSVLRADRHGELTVAFLDVGQGDAIYIEAPNGNQILIDGGPSAGGVLRALGSVMPFYDRSIDLVLATHPDQDHVGGLPSVLERMSVAVAVTTDNSSNTGAYAEFENNISNKHVQRILARAGERFILDNGVVLEILFPNQSVKGWETNKGSIIARLSYGNESFLFTGDSPQAIEKYLVGKEGSALHTNVLKLGHHGSKSASAPEFLSAVNPDYAIISAGIGNKYGHPNKEVLDLLTKLKIQSLSTIEHGTIIFKTDGVDLAVE
jgi:competence protein ComEC